jgi:hypothetical protein
LSRQGARVRVRIESWLVSLGLNVPCLVGRAASPFADWSFRNGDGTCIVAVTATWINNVLEKGKLLVQVHHWMHTMHCDGSQRAIGLSLLLMAWPLASGQVLPLAAPTGFISLSLSLSGGTTGSRRSALTWANTFSRKAQSTTGGKITSLDSNDSVKTFVPLWTFPAKRLIAAFRCVGKWDRASLSTVLVSRVG